MSTHFGLHVRIPRETLTIFIPVGVCLDAWLLLLLFVFALGTVHTHLRRRDSMPQWIPPKLDLSGLDVATSATLHVEACGSWNLSCNDLPSERCEDLQRSRGSAPGRKGPTTTIQERRTEPAQFFLAEDMAANAASADIVRARLREFVATSADFQR